MRKVKDSGIVTNVSDCKHYIKGGLCSHPDAPKPHHSRCLEISGRRGRCEVYEVYKKLIS